MSLAGIAGFEAGVDDKVLLAPLPSDLGELVAHPLAAEKLMPVLGDTEARGAAEEVRRPDERRALLFTRVEALLDDVGIPCSLAEGLSGPPRSLGRELAHPSASRP